MPKPSKTKKAEKIGKGKVTPVQIAFIVDRYLADNNYSQTRSSFRTEASSLISKSPIREAPKTLLTLADILDEYISLKEQRVTMDHHQCRLDQEKCRVQNLLQGMQTVMNAYNSSAAVPSLPAIPPVSTQSMAMLPNTDPSIVSPAGYPAYNTPVATSMSKPLQTNIECTNFCTPMANLPSTKKRQGSKIAPDALPASKKSSSQLNTMQLPTKVSDKATKSNHVPDNQENLKVSTKIKGCSVAKSLFNQPSSSPPNSTDPKTPSKKFSSPNEKSVFPMEASSANTSKENTPTDCIVISSEKVALTPSKQIAYYSIERNHCIASSSPVRRPSKRDHVKGRLDFDGLDVPTNSDKPEADGVPTSISNIDMDLFDDDLPNFDSLGVDFSLSELLLDFDIDCEGINYPCAPSFGSSLDHPISGSSQEYGDGNLGANQVLSELSSTVTEVLSEKDMNIKCPDTVTSVKSITKRIRILSPAKNSRSSSLDQENVALGN